VDYAWFVFGVIRVEEGVSVFGGVVDASTGGVMVLFGGGEAGAGV